MAILKPDKTSKLGGVTVNEYLLRKQMEWIVYGDDQGDQK